MYSQTGQAQHPSPIVIALRAKDHRVASPSCGWPPCDLITFAAHVGIPVNERTVGVVPPCPDVQFEVCRQTVSVRAANELERLPLEYRRTVVMRQPSVGDDNELHADQLQPTIG